MQYLCLIYGDEKAYEAASPEETQQTMSEYMQFGEKHGPALRGGEALQPTSTATTIRVRNGDRMLTDGPFAETSEQLGGYYVVEADDLDAALAVAADIPGASDGCVEVRPIIDFTNGGTPA